MTDIFDNNPFKSFFFADDNKNVPQALRQKIALAMLMQKKPFPKTFGEGLASIGDSFSDNLVMRRIEAEAAKGEQEKAAARGEIIGTPLPPPARASSFAPESDVQGGPLPAPQQFGGVSPAVPLPEDQQQSDDPNAPFRLSRPDQLRDFRLQRDQEMGRTRSVVPQPPPPLQQPPQALPAAAPPPPPPPLPPSPPAQGFGDRFDAAFPGGGPQSAAPPMDPRQAIATAMMPQGAAGGPPQNPMPAPDQIPVGSPPSDPMNAMAFAGPEIKTAPPAAPLRKVPPPQQVAEGLPAADYVTPLRSAPKPPPTMTPLMQKIQDKINATPPAYRDSVIEGLTPIYENEQNKLKQLHEVYKDEMTQRRALELKREDQLAGARSRVDAARAAELAAEKARQDIAKGKEPTLREDVETKHIYNPETGMYEAPKIAGADSSTKPAFKGTEFQGKALVNYGRARIAQEGLRGDGEKVLAESPLQAALSAVPMGAGRSLRSDEYKEADTHADNFVQAFIRQQSGGAYTDPELEKEARAMLPKYGDTEKQLQTKREQREQFLSGMYSVIGSSGQKGVDIDAAKRAADRERAAAEKPPAASQKYEEGTEAVWPDKTIRVYRNGKWVPK